MRIAGPSATWMNMEVLVRLFFGFVLLHTLQEHPGTGTPVEVPHPSTVTWSEGAFSNIESQIPCGTNLE